MTVIAQRQLHYCTLCWKHIMDLNTCKRIFARMDTSSEGCITISSFYDAMNTIGVEMSLQEAESVVNLVCTRGTHTLNFKEFMHLMYILDNAVQGDIYSIAFLAADIDYSNTIEEQELERILNYLQIHLEANDIHSIFQKYGTKGHMSYKQFMAFAKTIQ